MLNINFNLKSVKHDKERPINMVVRWNKNRLIYAIQEKILPKYFETERGKKLTQRVRASYPGYAEFNARLDYIESTTGTAFRRFINDQHRVPTHQELRRLLDVGLRSVGEKEKPNLISFIDGFIKNAEGKVNHGTGKIISFRTIQKYRTVVRRLREFEVYSHRKVDFDSINMEFYQQWIEFLSVDQNLSHNTCGKYTKLIRQFLNEATQAGLNSNLIYKGKRFKILNEIVYKPYLNERELLELYQLDLSHSKRLEQVRDLFLVGCWTGLRFSDLVNIAPEALTGGMLSIKTRKTGEQVVLPLHWMVRAIMEKYSDQPNSLPPGISNVNMNLYIKEVCAMIPSLQAGVQSSVTKGGRLVTSITRKSDLITTHSARRSFATNLYLSGVNSLTIMKLTGHKTISVFMSYVKATAEESANVVQEHWSKKEALVQAGVSPATQEVLPQQANNLN